MNYFAAAAAVILTILSFVGGCHYEDVKNQKAWDAFQIKSTQAVADAKAKAADEQKQEDAQLLSEAKSATSKANAVAAISQRQLSDFKANTKAVSNVPEVSRWLNERIPYCLLAGLPDGPSAASGHCPRPDPLPAYSSGPTEIGHNRL